METVLREVSPIGLDVEIILSGVVQVGDIQVDLQKGLHTFIYNDSRLYLYLIIQHVLSVPGSNPGVTAQPWQYPGDYLSEVLNTLNGRHCVNHLVNVSLLPEIEQ